MKKILAGVLGVTMVLTGMTGCASKEDNGPKVLDVVWFSDGKEGETFKRLAEQYEKENPGIKVELIEVPYEEVENKVKNMINGKDTPAIARLSNVGIFENQLVDLYDYTDDKEALKANFSGAMSVEFGGKMIAAPMDVTANGLIYNKDAFKQAGVEVPQSEEEIWTWQEWEDAMVKVMENSDVKYGLVFDKSPHRFATLLYQAGGSMMNEDMTASTFNSPEALRAVNFFKELHDKEIIPKSIWLGSENPNNMFRTGQIAMHFCGNWMVANYKDEITDFEWGVTYMPQDAKRATVPGGKYIGAFKGSGVEKEAADFIQWLSRPENNAVYCTENNYLSPVVGNESLDYEYGKEFFEIYANELGATDKIPGAEWGYQEFTSRTDMLIKEGLINVLAEKMTPEEYLADMEKVMNEALAEIK